jgi:hypothetical protein
MTDRDVFAATRLGRHVLDAVGSACAGAEGVGTQIR